MSNSYMKSDLGQAERDALAETYTVRAAQDSCRSNYGSQRYWDYLEASGIKHRDYFLARGDQDMADEMMQRTLGEALRGNDGE